ncbi:TMEM175 family protein [Microbacterium sp. P04]|uniref:TMEM175 family protein n=1 Tax=Microbacterium sp. P04 TaxID=3366947 RepID=UPI003746428B
MFSDAVFAISITLLVLDLPVPTSGSFGEELLAAWPSFVAYLAAFLTIAGIWVHHHTVFARVKRVEPVIVVFNLLLLLGVSLLPWPTALLSQSIRGTDHLDGVIACVAYAAAALVVMIAWLAMTWVLARRPHLLRRPSDAAWMRRSVAEVAWAGTPVIAALGVAFLNPVSSLLLFVAIPVYFLYSTSRARPVAVEGAGGDRSG